MNKPLAESTGLNASVEITTAVAPAKPHKFRLAATPIQRPALCIYHANCADGFAAAWAVRKALGDEVDFYPGVYGEPPPAVDGRHVILVDFSYKRDTLLTMAELAEQVLILDHHKTAETELVNLPANVECVFDMHRSGAMITWEYFHPNRTPPRLLEYIQDRDLWRFELEHTREVTAGLFSYPYRFEEWDWLMNCNLHELAREGGAILRKQAVDVAQLIATGKQRITLMGYNVPVLNAPYFLSSDCAGTMAKGQPFAACYSVGVNGLTFSLRSSKSGEDVAAIAEAFGGGGHKHAAGFKLSAEQFMFVSLAINNGKNLTPDLVGLPPVVDAARGGH